MPTHVYANNNEVASKAADGKSIAAFPDVCFSPPAPPVGPMPLPYPNTGEVKDTDSGTAKVFIKDKMSGMAGDSHMTKSMGDDAATKNFNKGMITGALQGKCYFGLWSMDVQMEGKGVPRHLDMVTHNHASMMGQIPGVDTDQTSGNNSTKTINTFEQKGHCYELNFFDMYGNAISDELFKNKNTSLKSNAKLKFLNTDDGISKTFECKTILHDYSNYIAFTIDESCEDEKNSSEEDFPFKELFYNMFKMEYTSSNESKEFTCNTSMSYYDVIVLHNLKQTECKDDDGFISTTDVKLVPTPHFPVLVSGAWEQSTAYNLSLMSYIAYGGFDKNEDGNYYGSLKHIARDLCVSTNACIKDGKRFICNKVDLKNNYIYCHHIQSADANCFILANKDNIIISFRGSKEEADFIADMKIFMDEYDSGSGSTIHRGFSQYYAILHGEIFSEIKKLYKNQNIFIAGHSLGGALGLICACEIKRCFKNSNVSLYSYGMPRVFNSVAISELPDFPHYRHVFESDPVPRLVLSKFLPDDSSQLRLLAKDPASYFMLKRLNTDVRQHHGEIYYIERDRSLIGGVIREFLAPKNVVTSTAKSQASNLSLNPTFSLYIFKGKNRNFANSQFDNRWQSGKASILWGVSVITLGIEFLTMHTIDNYVKSLQINLKKNIVVGNATACAIQESEGNGSAPATSEGNGSAPATADSPYIKQNQLLG